MLDDAGFPRVQIVASNELDEQIIDSIRDEGGKVDIYGVGTKLAVCAGEGGGALGGVYKLVRSGGLPRMKVTSDLDKATLPGRKRLLRAVAPDGSFIQDVICRDEDDPLPGETVYDPANPLRHVSLPADARLQELRSSVMENGVRCAASPDLDAMADRCADQLRRLPPGCLRFINPHRYKVSISRNLNDLRLRVMAEVETKNIPHGLNQAVKERS
jgi:nicotinate phosphoribosyltransferase